MADTGHGSILSRQSLLDRAKRANVSGNFALREYAINQLLHRLNAVAGDAWLLKGGDALITRKVSSRATQDIDARSSASDIDEAREVLEAALALDLGDGVGFDQLKSPQDISGAATGSRAGLRFSIHATLDGNLMENLKLDLVVGGHLTGDPARVQRALPFEVAGIEPVTVCVYPVVDHIADKVCATLQTYGTDSRESSRARDLYDLCALGRVGGIAAQQLAAAIEAQRLVRGIEPLKTFGAPASWRSRYERLASTHQTQGIPLSFDEAQSLVSRLINPVLVVPVMPATWDPQSATWIPD